MIRAVKYRVVLTFTEPALGTAPMDKAVYRTYLESRKPKETDDDESASIENREERGWTGYHADPTVYQAAQGGETTDRALAGHNAAEQPIVLKRSKLFAFDYTLRGFLKESANALRQCQALDVSAVKSKIDQFVFVAERRVYFQAPVAHLAGPVTAGGCGHGVKDGACYFVHTPNDVLERPLRAETMQGPRVTLVRSDVLEPGHRLEFTLKVLWPKVFDEELLRTILERGEYVGWGQWRTGSYGRFSYELIADDGNAAIEAEMRKKSEAIAAKPKGRPKKAAAPTK